MYPSNGNPIFINMSQESVDMRDSYLGEEGCGGRGGGDELLGKGRGVLELRPGPLRLLC